MLTVEFSLNTFYGHEVADFQILTFGFGFGFGKADLGLAIISLIGAGSKTSGVKADSFLAVGWAVVGLKATPLVPFAAFGSAVPGLLLNTFTDAKREIKRSAKMKEIEFLSMNKRLNGLMKLFFN